MEKFALLVIQGYEGGGLVDTPIIPPKGFQDKTEALAVAFEAMIGHITGTGFGGKATLSVKSFLGRFIKSRLGLIRNGRGRDVPTCWRDFFLVKE